MKSSIPSAAAMPFAPSLWYVFFIASRWVRTAVSHLSEKPLLRGYMTMNPLRYSRILIPIGSRWVKTDADPPTSGLVLHCLRKSACHVDLGRACYRADVDMLSVAWCLKMEAPCNNVWKRFFLGRNVWLHVWWLNFLFIEMYVDAVLVQVFLNRLNCILDEACVLSHGRNILF